MNNEYFHELYRDDRNESEYYRVATMARSIYAHTLLNEISQNIGRANRPNANSDEVAECIRDYVETLGFEHKNRTLFPEYAKKYVPDFYFNLSGDRGIMFEIERGRATENNNDLLALWKRHICRSTQYLFLTVPLLYRSGKVYPSVLIPRLIDHHP